MKQRKLFCQCSPLCYEISLCKCRLLRRLQDICRPKSFAHKLSQIPLPCLIYKQNALMRRKLGNVDAQLQENKVVNLGLAAPKVSGILIKPGETFSFWRLVGSCTQAKGYQTGLVIANGTTGSDVGGGMCQFTNLIHWLILHTPLTIVEHHHHDGLDLFPDFGRQLPFGTGTSIMYNFLDYRFKNNTNQVFQLIFYTTDTYLCGEVRSTQPLLVKYHIKVEGECFVQRGDHVYRTGKIYRECIDVKTGIVQTRKLLKENNARVLYSIESTKISKEIENK